MHAMPPCAGQRHQATHPERPEAKRKAMRTWPTWQRYGEGKETKDLPCVPRLISVQLAGAGRGD